MRASSPPAGPIPLRHSCERLSTWNAQSPTSGSHINLPTLPPPWGFAEFVDQTQAGERSFGLDERRTEVQF